MFGVCRSAPRDVPATAPPPPPPGAGWPRSGSASPGKAHEGFSVRERMVAASRNLKLTGKVVPIALRFREAQRRMRAVHKRLRRGDPDAYYAERNRTWDEVHVREAPGIAAIGREMGGPSPARFPQKKTRRARPDPPSRAIQPSRSRRGLTDSSRRRFGRPRSRGDPPPQTHGCQPR